MYATVDITTGAPQNYITLPQTALTFSPYGNTVYIVDDKGKDCLLYTSLVEIEDRWRTR